MIQRIQKEPIKLNFFYPTVEISHLIHIIIHESLNTHFLNKIFIIQTTITV